MIEMPDHGEINETYVSKVGTVFSGHFHKRQSRENVWYIGNAFPHNYADAGDDARGMTIIEWDKPPQFYSWPDQPRFRVYKLSEVLEDTDALLVPRSNIRVHLDIDISYEEANFIKETLVPKYSLREMALIPVKNEQHALDLAPGELKFESVDGIMIDQISNIESQFYDPKLLLEIYKNL